MMHLPVLVVDDEPNNLALIQQILGKDYQLFFARSGAECLKAAKKHQPALILLDIQMPDMDGYLVCNTLKSDPSTENIPVIFVSALSDVGNEAAGFLCGGVDYLIKPVSPALVLARVKTHLSLVRASRLEAYIEQLEIERAKTTRLSRILAFLSNTNSMIVRTKDTRTLFNEACEIAVKQGGFGIAWIIQTEAPKQMDSNMTDLRELTLVANTGLRTNQQTHLLEQLKVPNSDTLDIPRQVYAHGAIRFCNDIRNYPGADPHLQDMLHLGLLSVVGLPLFTFEKIVAIMVLYARDANYFDEEELKLLSELAGDISFALQAIEYEKKAQFLSYFDALTALPNTALFFDRLHSLIKAAQANEDSVFVIAINIHHFKQINDSLGRHIGDQVLRIVGKRLHENFSPHYCVARTGADNFIIAGSQTRSEKAAGLCKKILVLLESNIAVDQMQLNLSAHLGIAMYPADASDSETLFKNAEAAVKQSKSDKTNFTFYSPDINAKIIKKIETEQLLRAAIHADQFILHYQPKIDLKTGEIVAAEALIRWQHPLQNIVLPTEFIPVAEESGMILAIGEWVIRSVCAQQATWLQDAMPVVPVALNLSALQFTNNHLLDIVQDSLKQHHLAPHWIELELTETMVMENPEATQRAMHKFREMGIRLYLDDFGTGYSSLAYLKRFPFHAVKIDRTFVTDIPHNTEDTVIATAIIAMAHSLNMRVIAEGVENEDQLDFLRHRDCDEMQGYLFSPPVSAQEFATMLRKGKRIQLKGCDLST
ncbi:MAG: EAL domain-containing protein [Burkholderiales bacterium]|nr:EAL domain-containing protein [Burkholderiales bacterium]